MSCMAKLSKKDKRIILQEIKNYNKMIEEYCENLTRDYLEHIRKIDEEMERITEKIGQRLSIARERISALETKFKYRERPNEHDDIVYI